MLQEMSRTLADMGDGGGVGSGQPLSDPLEVSRPLTYQSTKKPSRHDHARCEGHPCKPLLSALQGVGGLLGTLLGGASMFQQPQRPQNQSPVLSANSCFDINRTLAI